jgi:Fe-Mn family superoxide dismutase
MNKFTRREAMETLITGSAGLALATTITAEAQTNTSAAARAFGGQHQPKPLPFDPAKPKGLSEKLIRSHHVNWEVVNRRFVRAQKAAAEPRGERS